MSDLINDTANSEMDDSTSETGDDQNEITNALWICLGVIVVGVYFWGLAAVLKTCVGLLFIAAVGFGVWGTQESNPDDREGAFACAGAAGVLGLFLSSLNYAFSDDANTQYWEKLYEVTSECAVAEQTMNSATNKRPENAYPLFAACRRAADVIDELETDGVDDSLVEFSERLSVHLRKKVELYTEILDFATRYQAANSGSSIVATMVESALRGYLGDPLGKAVEIQKEEQSFAREKQQIGYRFGPWEAEANELRRLEQELREKIDQDLPVLIL